MEPGSITIREMIWRETDPDSGSRMLQVTSAPGVHMNIYGEVPYMDAASRKFVYTCAPTSHSPVEVWCADLERQWASIITDDITGIRGVAVSPDNRFFYCTRARDEGFQVLRTALETLEQTTVDFPGPPLPRTLGTVAPDNRTYVFGTQLEPGLFGIVRCDLETGRRQVIHEGAEIFNSHPQLEPGKGRDCLIQHNRGCQFDEQGRYTRLTGDMGATLYVIDTDGGNFRQLPVGKPHTPPVQGHQCWIGSTGKVLLTTCRAPMEDLLEDGNLLAVRPGDEKADVVAKGCFFWHPNASRCGRYFVSDVTPDALILVGSIRTGKTRVLHRAGASCGSPQYTHPHPYFSPDCKWVIFNSDRTGVPHVYAATVPEGMLEELDSD